MPTLLLLKGLRFFFYSNEGNEPMHVHVMKGNAEGKLWLEPSIKVVYWVYCGRGAGYSGDCTGQSRTIQAKME